MSKEKRKTELKLTAADREELAALRASAEAGTLELRDLTSEEERLHERVGLPGRPRVGEGSERILVTVERGLLRKLDALAGEAERPRAQVIAFALKLLLAEGEERALEWVRKHAGGKPKSAPGKGYKGGRTRSSRGQQKTATRKSPRSAGRK